MMKNYRGMVPICLIILMALSFYKMINSSITINDEYNNYLVKARKYASDRITKLAIENYNKAIAIHSSPDIYVEVSEYFKKEKLPKDNLDWCKTFLETYPTEPKAYDCILQIYFEDEDYTSCYDVLNVASKRNVSSEYISSINDTIKYKYYLDYNSYSEVGVFSNNYCSVFGKDYWGYVDRFGNQKISCQYLEVGSFTQSGYAPVLSKEKEVYFIDKEGDKVIAVSGQYQSFGLLVNNIFPAEKMDNKYVYLKENSESNYFNVNLSDTQNNDLYIEASDMYDYASSFNNGIAVVKINDKWKIIDESFKLGENSYYDIKLDEKNIATRNDRMFVSNSSGSYHLANTKGEIVGNQDYEDANVFLSDAPTSVKINGKWKYIDKDGNFISEKQYDNAHPFCNALAAICVNGKWGFIDENEAVVIDPQFEDCKDFNDKGSCFVKENGKWRLLKLYRLNRKG